MAWIAAAAAVVGAGVTVYGAVQQAKAQEDVGAAELEIGRQEQANLEYNAAAQMNQALVEEQATAHEAAIFAGEGRALTARQRVQFAKAGVTMEGTPSLVLEDTANKLQQDLDMMYWGGAQRASFIRQEAGMSIRRGKTAARAGGLRAEAAYTRAGTSLLSGVSGGLYGLSRASSLWLRRE